MAAFLIILLVVIIVGCIVKYSLNKKKEDEQGATSSFAISAPKKDKSDSSATELTDGYNQIEDFFNIDIRDIFKYNPEYTHTELSATGNEVKHYRLRLKQLELGIFYELDILKVGENECNITFKGRSNAIAHELARFLEFYTDKYGLDEMGCGKVDYSDYSLLESHLFSRMWKNLMIDNNSINESNGNIEMCIMGIKTK